MCVALVAVATTEDTMQYVKNAVLLITVASIATAPFIVYVVGYYLLQITRLF